jgi:hypothetical protein
MSSSVQHAQSAETEWIDDPRPHHVNEEESTQATNSSNGMSLSRQRSLRERHAELQQRQRELRRHVDNAEVWGTQTESYESLVEERLRLFYLRYLPAGVPHPDVRRAYEHFGGNLHELNKALRLKYGADLDDARCRVDSNSPPGSQKDSGTPLRDHASSEQHKPATVCQCIADFVDHPASPFAAVGLKSKDFSTRTLHCGHGGTCEALGEVGEVLWEIPGQAVDGFTEGFKHASKAVSEGPQEAVCGIETAFRHEQPVHPGGRHPETEGYV